MRLRLGSDGDNRGRLLTASVSDSDTNVYDSVTVTGPRDETTMMMVLMYASRAGSGLGLRQCKEFSVAIGVYADSGHCIVIHCRSRVKTAPRIPFIAVAPSQLL